MLTPIESGQKFSYGGQVTATRADGDDWVPEGEPFSIGAPKVFAVVTVDEGGVTAFCSDVYDRPVFITDPDLAQAEFLT